MHRAKTKLEIRADLEVGVRERSSGGGGNGGLACLYHYSLDGVCHFFRLMVHRRVRLWKHGLGRGLVA